MNNLDLNKKLLNLMESAMMEKKKPDADGDGVPDWADKKPGQDDNEGKKKGSKPKKGEVPPQFQKESVKEAEEAKMPSKAEVMKCCKDGMSVSEICKKYPDCDQDKLKELCKDCKAEMKEKTDESITTLSDSLKQKLTAVMETSEEVTETSEEELDEEQDLDAESVAEQEEVTEDESLDEMAELLKMAGLDEGDFVGEESEAEMDDHAEKAGDEVAHDMEYDDDHNSTKDDHDEHEGDKVTREIEFDDKEHEAMKSLLKKLLDA